VMHPRAVIAERVLRGRAPCRTDLRPTDDLAGSIDSQGPALAASQRPQVLHDSATGEEGVTVPQIISGPRCTADDQTRVIDATGLTTEPAERPQVVHPGRVEEESMLDIGGGARDPNHLAAVVHAVDVAVGAAQRPQVG